MSTDILDQHAAFLRSEFKKDYCHLPAYQIFQRMYPSEDDLAITARVTEMMGRFDQALAGRLTRSSARHTFPAR